MVYSKLEHHIDDIWEEARAVRSHSTRLRALRRGSSCAGDDPSSHCPTARRPSADSAYMHGSGSRQPSACDSASIQGAGGVLEGSSSAAGRRASGYPSGSGLMVLEGASGLHSGPPSSSGDSGPLPEGHPSSYLASCNSKRLCTSAMLKVWPCPGGLPRMCAAMRAVGTEVPAPGQRSLYHTPCLPLGHHWFNAPAPPI
jgi:hypothetical protein